MPLLVAIPATLASSLLGVMPKANTTKSALSWVSLSKVTEVTLPAGAWICLMVELVLISKPRCSKTCLNKLLALASSCRFSR